MCGSSADDDPFNRRAAGLAGGVGLAVDFVQALEAALLAVGVYVVAQGAAAVADGLAEGLLDRAIQGRDLGERQAISGGEGVDAGLEEGFVDVNVAQAGDETLV